jgi:hypothetical protein
MMAQTAIAEAFSAKGVTPYEAAFRVALARYQNNGGTYELALAMLNVAYGKGSGGHELAASNGRRQSADASLTNDGEAGPRAAAERADSNVPVSPSTERRAGHGLCANDATPAMPVAASPVSVIAHNRHKPGHARRGAVEIAAADATAKRTVFATIRLPDGRMLGEVRWSEAPQLAQTHARVARVLIAAHRYATPVDPSTSLDECVPPDEQRNIVTMVERINAL